MSPRIQFLSQPTPIPSPGGVNRSESDDPKREPTKNSNGRKKWLAMPLAVTISLKEEKKARVLR